MKVSDSAYGAGLAWRQRPSDFERALKRVNGGEVADRRSGTPPPGDDQPADAVPAPVPVTPGGYLPTATKDDGGGARPTIDIRV